jgi:hypothetical protein
MSITKILEGIDRCEVDHTDGWWETSSGAAFGRLKLVEAQGYEFGLLSRVEALEKEAKRYQWLTTYLVSDRDDLDDDLVACDSKNKFDEIIDAAIAGEAT